MHSLDSLRTKIKKIDSLLRSIFADGLGSGKLECPICGWTGKEFLVYGPFQRKNVECPQCLSHERHRLMYLYLKKYLPGHAKISLLHFAPEKSIADFLKTYKNIDYLSADLDTARAMVKQDITNISLEDNSFDYIICSHVLEHVIDDRKGMQELFRVLKPGGSALIEVPVDKSRQSTYEDFSITAPEERLKAFNQDDHVRIYGLDYKNRLQAAGFKVKIVAFKNKNLISKYGLISGENLYICQKQFKRLFL